MVEKAKSKTAIVIKIDPKPSEIGQMKQLLMQYHWAVCN